MDRSRVSQYVSIVALAVSVYSLFVVHRIESRSDSHSAGSGTTLRNEKQLNEDLDRLLRTAKCDYQTELELDLTGKHYGRLDSPLGSFLVVCSSVRPYLSGSQVILNVANLTSMSFSQFTLQIESGTESSKLNAQTRKRFVLGDDKYLDEMSVEELRELKRWKQAAKEHRMTDVLTPGQWVSCSPIQVPEKPDQLGFIRLRISLYDIQAGRP